MNTLTLPAHFDGEKIQLDQPYKLEPNMRLAVVILPQGAEDGDRAEWLQLAMQNFADGFGENEPEYSLDDIKEWNPEYEGR